MNILKQLKGKAEERIIKTGGTVRHAAKELNALMACRSGDQITGWLIVVLLVVVCGAVFLNLYQSSIQEIWAGIITKMKTVFGL